MNLRLQRFAAVAALLVTAAPMKGSAQAMSSLQWPPQPIDAERDALPFLELARRATTIEVALKAYDAALAKAPARTRFRGMIQCQRSGLLDRLEQREEARAAAAECGSLLPDEPRALLVLAASESYDKRFVESVRLIVRAAKQLPEAVQLLPGWHVATLVRNLDYARAETEKLDLLRLLVSADYAAGGPEFLSTSAATLARDAASRNRPDEVRALLPRIVVPEVFLSLLVDRSLEPLWPELERLSAGTVEPQRARYLEQTRAAYAIDATSQTGGTLATALWATGHRGEAITVLQEVIANTADRDDFSNVELRRMLARRLQAAGRNAEARAIYERIRTTEPKQPNGTELNNMPNYALYLITTGAHAEALAMLDKETPTVDQVEAPEAIGFYRALRACAMAGLGRTAEASRLYAEVKQRYTANQSAYRYALACAAPHDEQVDYLISELEKPKERSLLVALAAARTPIGRSDQKITPWGRLVYQLADDPRVRAASDRLGRTLPTSYEAALNDWRTAE